MNRRRSGFQSCSKDVADWVRIGGFLATILFVLHTAVGVPGWPGSPSPWLTALAIILLAGVAGGMALKGLLDDDAAAKSPEAAALPRKTRRLPLWNIVRGVAIALLLLLIFELVLVGFLMVLSCLAHRTGGFRAALVLASLGLLGAFAFVVLVLSGLAAASRSRIRRRRRPRPTTRRSGRSWRSRTRSPRTT